MGGFHGPNTLLEPIDEREIVGGAAKDRLAEVNVSLNETGNHCAIGRVYYSVGCLARSANLGYAFVTNEKIAAHDGVRRVHRDERAVSDED
jgi:hypothetical protein